MKVVEDLRYSLTAAQLALKTGIELDNAERELLDLANATVKHNLTIQSYSSREVV
jgi:hypothetical protein